MKRIFLFLLLLIAIKSQSQSLYFPPIIGSTWDTISPSSIGWCENKIPDLINYLEDKNTKAFIVLKDGKIVIEKYFGTFTKDSAWYWASAGKSLTAFVVGIAQQENYLKISDTSSNYLGQSWTNCSIAQEEKITIRHQLTMTSGLDDGVADNYCTLDSCLVYKSDAGTRWAYHNAPYTLLDKVIENATGQSLNNYINQKLKIPIGMTGTYVQSGFNNVFVSKARSMARYGLLILNKGNWNGNQILSDTNYFNQMVNSSQNLNPSYGYLWWLNGKASFMVPGYQLSFQGSPNPSAPSDMIAALGKNGQIINIVPSQKLVYIRMGEAPGVGEVPITFNDTIWQKLKLVMCNTGIEEQSLSKADLKVYPNPANSNTYVQISNQYFDVKLFDLSGRNLLEKHNCFDKVEIDCTKLESGIYTLQISSGTYETQSKKLIVVGY